MKLAARLAWVLLLSSGGCSYLVHTAENVFAAPVDKIDEYVFQCRLHRLGRDALVKIQREEGKPFGDAYQHGFVHGFVDYIDRNGGGVPPAIPPYHLQRSALRNLEKQNDIEDWYAGFRHGVVVAQASGLRERVLIPISLPPAVPTTDIDRPIQTRAPGSATPDQPAPLPPPQQLPMPQQLRASPQLPPYPLATGSSLVPVSLRQPAFIPFPAPAPASVPTINHAVPTRVPSDLPQPMPEQVRMPPQQVAYPLAPYPLANSLPPSLPTASMTLSMPTPQLPQATPLPQQPLPQQLRLSPQPDPAPEEIIWKRSSPSN